MLLIYTHKIYASLLVISCDILFTTILGVDLTLHHQIEIY